MKAKVDLNKIAQVAEKLNGRMFWIVLTETYYYKFPVILFGRVSHSYFSHNTGAGETVEPTFVIHTKKKTDFSVSCKRNQMFDNIIAAQKYYGEITKSLWEEKDADSLGCKLESCK